MLFNVFHYHPSLSFKAPVVFRGTVDILSSPLRCLVWMVYAIHGITFEQLEKQLLGC